MVDSVRGARVRVHVAVLVVVALCAWNASCGGGAARREASSREADGRWLTVRCIEKGSQRPIAGAEVAVMPRTADMWDETIAARDGWTFASMVRRRGRRFATADAQGVARVWASDRNEAVSLGGLAPPRWVGMTRVEVPGGPDVTLEFEPASLARARVVDDAGQAVRDVLVELFVGAPDEARRIAMARTDERGVAELELLALPRDPELRLVVDVVGLLPRRVEAVLDADALETVGELRLPPYGTMAISAEGIAPPEGLLVSLTPLAGGGSQPVEVGLLRGDTLLFAPVALGVEVEAVGRSATSTVRWRGRARGPESPGALARVVVAREPAVEVVGRAVDASGEPLRGAILRASLSQSGTRSEETDWRQPVPCDDAGAFRWEAPDGPWDRASIRWVLDVGGSEWLAASHCSPPVDGRVELGDVVLRPPVRLVRARFVDASGAPIGDVDSGWSSDDGIGHELVIGDIRRASDGSFELLGVASPESKHSIWVSAAGFRDAERRFTLGDDLGDWVLERVAVARGRLLLPDGVPHEHVRVSGAALDADGAFEVDMAEPGELRLVLESPLWIGRDLVLWSGQAWPAADRDLGTLDFGTRLATTRLVPAAGAVLPPSLGFEKARQRHAIPPQASVWTAVQLSLAGPSCETVELSLQPDGTALLLHDAELEGRLIVHGGRDTPLPRGGGVQELDPRPALEVEVRCDGARADGARADGTKWFALLIDPERPDVLVQAPLQDGRATLHPDRPGPWRARVAAWDEPWDDPLAGVDHVVEDRPGVQLLEWVEIVEPKVGDH